MHVVKLLTLFIYLGAIIFTKAYATDIDKKQPYLYVLGVAQDAGYPQAGCYQPHCLPGWQNHLLKRNPVSLGLIDPDGQKKYIFEATPNFPEQLYFLEQEAPSHQYLLDGIFITHAHIGHYTGLMFLGHEAMSAKNIPVYAMPRMSAFLKNNGPWDQLVNYKNIKLVNLVNNQAQSLGQIEVTPFIVPHRDEYSETVGYKIQGPNKSAIFIPDIDKWSKWNTNIVELIKTVDYALLDAAFYDNQELPGRDMSKIPHPFVSESMHTFAKLSKQDKQKVWFIHMNHTNPLLNEDSEQSKFVRSQGYNIATKGNKLLL